MSPWDLASFFGWCSSTYGKNIWIEEIEGGSNDPNAITKSKAEITAQTIVTDWMNSLRHKANILNNNFFSIVILKNSSTKKTSDNPEFFILHLGKFNYLNKILNL